MNLSAVNTYSGPTTISAGTLNVTGTHAQNAAYNVSGGTLFLGSAANVTTSTLNSTGTGQVQNNGQLSSSGGGTLANKMTGTGRLTLTR